MGGDHELKADAYDRFADYVRNEMRDRDNPNLQVQEFELMRKSGVTHMELVLENVDKAKKRLYDLVERFDDRASLCTRESITTGNPIFVANIPFLPRGEKRSKGGHHHHHRDNIEAPSVNWFFLYMFLFMWLLIIGVWKTRWDEWAYILGR